MKYINSLYNWTLAKAAHPKAHWFLSFISFIESSIIPIPPDIILIPMIIANRLKAWWYAFICTISSVIGGIAGYCIGAFFYYWHEVCFNNWLKVMNDNLLTRPMR